MIMTTQARKRKYKSGQTLTEYALILAFISIVAVAVMMFLTTNVKRTYSTVFTSLASAQASH